MLGVNRVNKFITLCEAQASPSCGVRITQQYFDCCCRLSSKWLSLPRQVI